MEELKKICEMLSSRAYAEICNGIESVNTHEMYEVIDMIKDLKEAMYYGKITEAMEESESEDAVYYGGRRGGRRMHYEEPEWERETEYRSGRMYYSENGNSQKRMGRSGSKRARYYEAKETNDTSARMNTIDEYAMSLSDDILEMVSDATPNEKNLMKQKLQTIIARIN